MKRSPMHQMRDDTCLAEDGPDDQQPTIRFHEARAHVREAIRRAECDGISSETLAFALMSEALPRIVHKHGPAWVAAVLTRLAHRIAARQI